MQRERVATMKRKFVDLHLAIDPKDALSASRIVASAASLGYNLVAVPLSPGSGNEDEVRLRKICGNAKIDFASRADLRARTRNQLMNQLRKLRRKYEIVCVFCESKEIARQAAKDRRVDLLNFPIIDYTRRFLDRPEAELLCSSLAAWEIDTKPLFFLEGPTRIRFISTLQREISIAKDFKIPIVLSSGTSNELFLRKPRETAAIASLFGLDEVSALEAVSTTPFSIVKRNREKLGSTFVAPGIALVKEGKGS